MSRPARRHRQQPALAVIHPARQLGAHITRILTAAAHFRRAVAVDSVKDLRAEAGPETQLVFCGPDQVEEVVETCAADLPQMQLVVWTSTADRKLLEFAARIPRIASVLAWREDDASPRPWELALPVRRMVARDPTPLRPRDFLQWEGPYHEWLPRSTEDLSATLEEVVHWMEKLGISQRTSRRVMGVGHELLMNAMYDAPVDAEGRPVFAHYRTEQITLAPQDAPQFLLATDGLTLVLQVTDRFGGLCREHVYASVQRGLRSRDRDASRDEVVDTGHGGAGLGMYKMFLDANSLIFDVVSQRATVATATFDLNQSHRELRTGPRSLHFFRRSDADALSM